NLYGFAKKFRFFLGKHIYISLYFGQDFSNKELKAGFGRLCIHANRINSVFSSQKNGAFVMCFLCDNGEGLLSKNLLGPQYRIQRSKPGKIQYDSITRDSFFL